MFFPMQYKRVMWGLIIALADIRIGPIDIIPDFFGYILITMGLGELDEQHSDFGKAKNFSQWLILFSIPDIYKFPGNNIYFMIISMAGVIIKLLMVYYICRAISEISEERNFDTLYRKADSMWKAYLFINGAMLLLTTFLTSMISGYASFLVFPIIIALVVEILLISLVYTAGEELA